MFSASCLRSAISWVPSVVPCATAAYLSYRCQGYSFPSLNWFFILWCAGKAPPFPLATEPHSRHTTRPRDPSCLSPNQRHFLLACSSRTIELCRVLLRLTAKGRRKTPFTVKKIFTSTHQAAVVVQVLRCPTADPKVTGEIPTTAVAFPRRRNATCVLI